MVHVLWPGVSVKLLFAHAVQVSAPSENVPRGHASSPMRSPLSVKFVRYPGWTMVHALCSVMSVNSPGPHNEQESLPRPEHLPGTQRSQPVWSALVLVPGSHLLQAVLAETSRTGLSPTAEASEPSDLSTG